MSSLNAVRSVEAIRNEELGPESSLNVAKSLDVYKRISIRQTDYECLYYIESEWATWGLPCLSDSLPNTLLQLAFSSYLTWGKLGACDGKRSSYHTLALAGEGLRVQ